MGGVGEGAHLRLLQEAQVIRNKVISGGHKMEDEPYLDTKYFIDPDIYNCPFCNRRHVSYSNQGYVFFNWSNSKKMCYLVGKM